nr:nose resistant to fluoxetine protein 6-like [Drosophila takahashii]
MVSMLVGFIALTGIALISAARPEDKNILQGFHHLKNLKPLGIEFADYFQNVTLNDLSLSDPRAPTQEDLLCLSDMTKLMLALQTGQYWALKMIDAWGSIPSGVLTGNSYDLGNFDECINIIKENIRGKYCFLTAAPSQFEGLSITTATCFPASCSAAHMNKFLSQMMKRVLNVDIPGTLMSISDSTCQTNESEPWDGLTIFAIVILSLMGSIVAFFTVYDYLICKNQDQLPVIVKVFSARANSRTIFRIVEYKASPNVIDCLSGIRCMSLFWVIYSHEYVRKLNSPNINLWEALQWVQTPFSSFIVHGFYCVDSFFFIGGMLVSLIALRMMDRTKGKLNVPLMYLHRFIRIVPILAVAILVYTKLLGVVAGGPLLKNGFSGKLVCQTSWYWTLLFVVNYTNQKCLHHTWYLAVDMQLFLISPILLIAIYKWGKKAAAGIIVLIILLSGCLFATMMVNNYSMMKNYTYVAQTKMYFATHTHATPWLIGFLFGYFLHLNQGRKFKLSLVAVWSGWILCLAMIFTSIFAFYPAIQSGAPPLSTLEESFYYTLTRLGWPMAIGWVVFACMQGYGGLANSFLSSPLWQPLSRLSYSIYIWHIFIQEINSRSIRTISYFSDYQVMLRFWTTFGFTVLLAFFMYLIVEAPIGGLDLFIRPQIKASASSKSKENSNEVQQNPVDDEGHSHRKESEERETSAQNKTDETIK